jgi:DNA mismatch repair protein MutL
MGFRGEALAALAAISKLEMRTSDGTSGCRVYVEGGNAVSMDTIVRNRGTTIEAKSLFYNTPARLKFQKSMGASSAAVLKIVQTISLAHPEVRFSVYSNGKMTLRCQESDWKLRAQEILGSFAHEVNLPMIRGLLGRPEEGKATRSGQTLFINRRPIFSPLIAKAVKEGFGTRMQESLFPTYLLFLELPPEWVDVNVHPQKKEVRFREESHIFQMVRGAVFQAFEGIQEIAPLPWEINRAPVSYSFQALEKPMTELFTAGYAPTVDWILPLPSEPLHTFRVEDAPLSLNLEKTSVPLTLLGDVLLVQIEQGWQLVDLRGAEARIVFEEMETPSPTMQPLLWPIEYESTDPEELVESLKAANIEARVTGKRMIAIDATVTNLTSSHIAEFVRHLGAPEKERRVAAALSKTYRLAKRHYSMAEASLIWEKLSRCKDTTYDPLGKKIVTPLTKEHLNGMFR